MGYRGLTVMEECPGGAPGTRQRIRRSQPRRMSGSISVGAAESHVFLDSLDVEVYNRLLAFVGEQEFQRFFAVHEAVLSQACSAGSFVKDGEIGFLVRISVGIIEAHPMTGQDSQGGGAETIGQLVTFRLTLACVAAPARGIVPFVAPAGGIHVDGNQADVPAAQLGANAVDSFAALGQRDVFVFRDQQGSVEVFGLEGGHNSPGDFAVVRPFKETAVRGALSCSFTAVSVVNQDFHRTQGLGCRSAEQR